MSAQLFGRKDRPNSQVLLAILTVVGMTLSTGTRGPMPNSSCGQPLVRSLPHRVLLSENQRGPPLLIRRTYGM